MSMKRDEIVKAIATLTEAIKTDEGKRIIDELKVKFEVVNDSEEWRDVEDYDGDYQISNFGRVRSRKSGEWRLMKTTPNQKGYLGVMFSRQGKTKRFEIHRIVATAFLPNPNNLPVVEHADDNKQNNHVSNLFWSTHSDNTRHAYERNLINNYTIKAKLKESDIKLIRQIYKSHDKNFGAKALAKKFGVTRATIENIVHDKTWKRL